MSESLPKIIAPPWPHKSVQANHHVDGYWRVTASGADGWREYAGPHAETKLMAIERWNAGFEVNASAQSRT